METIGDQGMDGLVAIANRGSAQREATQQKVSQLRLEAEALKKEHRDEESQSRLEEASRLRKAAKNDFLSAVVGEACARALRKGYPPKSEEGAAPADSAALAVLAKPERKAALALAASFTLTTRASELHSPERPGHLLRLFGQSDREQIQNANEGASVPQALALLNGPMASQLEHPLSKLHQQLAQAGGLRQKLDLIYLGLLSRRPNDQERAVLEEVMRDRGDKAPTDVIQALLTGTEFMFIQ
jgi:hypothetical protein